MDTSKLIKEMEMLSAKSKISEIVKSIKQDLSADGSSNPLKIAASIKDTTKDNIDADRINDVQPPAAPNKVSIEKLDEMLAVATSAEQQRDHAGRPVDEVGAPLAAASKCNICGRLLQSKEFYRKNKTFKSCNMCSEDRIAGMTREDIEKKHGVKPLPEVPHDVNPVINAKIAKGELPEVPSVPIVPQEQKKDDGPLMPLMDCGKVNQYEKLLGLPLTSASVWDGKIPADKILYQQKLAEMLAMSWLKGRNPMTFLVLAGARAVENSFPLVDTIYPTGISLSGYHKCLESRQKEIEDVLNEIMKDNPEFVTKYISNPWLKLAFILLMPAVEVAAANYAQKKTA